MASGQGPLALGRGLASPRRLRQKAVTVAEPVTAPGVAGFSLWVCTAKLRPVGPGGPLSSTSTTCMSVRLGQAGWSVWLAQSQPKLPTSLAHLRSATSTPITRSKPRLGAAKAAAAMVLELRGANGQSPRTGPSYSTVRDPLLCAAARGPSSRKPSGCVAIVTRRL